MKKILLPLAACALFAVSCGSKPATGTSTATATATVSDADRIAQGKTIFDNSCGKCHDLPNPTAHTDEQWVGIVKSMAKKSKLSEEQGAMVYDYIAANN